MSSDEFVAALCSLTATADKKQNIMEAQGLVEKAAKSGAKWVFLPEMFAFHGPYDQLFLNAEAEDGPLNQLMSWLAKKWNITLFAGSVGERPEGAKEGKIYNTQYVFGRDGSILAKYRKIHMFNLRKEDGTPLYCESDGYLPGDQLVTFDHEGWHIGLATCYDLRFPDMFSKLAAKAPLDLLAAPAAFTLQTGMYHWELLCRARAVEQLCYVAAANQVGTHSPGKSSYGHAIVVDPWANVIADTGNRKGIALATICKDAITFWRRQLPVLDNRRSDVY